MTFTYDLGGTGDALNISRVRMELGDAVEDAGVLPDGGNLDDAEIAVALAAYDDDIDLAVGALARILSRRWAQAVDVSVGPRRESLSQVSARWQALADDAIAKATGSGYAVFGMTPVREDGYSEEAG